VEISLDARRVKELTAVKALVNGECQTFEWFLREVRRERDR
jgi:hypothetical protein